MSSLQQPLEKTVNASIFNIAVVQYKPDIILEGPLTHTGLPTSYSNGYIFCDNLQINQL